MIYIERGRGNGDVVMCHLFRQWGNYCPDWKWRAGWSMCCYFLLFGVELSGVFCGGECVWNEDGESDALVCGIKDGGIKLSLEREWS